MHIDMSEESETAVFRATFPPIKSAILISGDGTGGSIKLEIPQMERSIFALLIDMCQDELIVTISRASTSLKESKKNGSTETRKRTAKRPTDVSHG